MAEMKCQCVVFDLDGTLLDSEKVILTTFQRVLLKLTGKMYELPDLKFSWGIPAADAARQLNISDAVLLQQNWDAEVERRMDEIHCFQGVEDMLDSLKKSGVRLGIVTSKTRHELDRGFRMTAYFESKLIVTADQTVKHKPEPEPLLEVLRRGNFRATDVIYIGDTVHDAQCASGAHVAFGLAVWGATSPRNIRADYYFATPQEVVSRLNADDP